MSKIRTPKDHSKLHAPNPAKAVKGRGAEVLGRKHNPVNWKGQQTRKPLRVATESARRYER